MVDTLLFDLDGTLLPINTDSFIENYFDLLLKKVSKWIHPRQFGNVLINSVTAMINDRNYTKLNKEVFWENFFSEIQFDLKKLKPIIDDFYKKDFPKLSKIAIKSPLSREILETASNRGYKIVLATSPVFPKVAILERLRWIDAHKFPFLFITTYENMHFAKPHIEYYKELLEKIEKKPQECIMIGNDVEEDLVAKNIGIKTFLVTDFIINRKNKKINADYIGSLKDLFVFINNL